MNILLMSQFKKKKENMSSYDKIHKRQYFIKQN